MTTRYAAASSLSPGAINELTARDVDSLRFGLWSRQSNEQVKSHLANYPGRSAWIPETLEYAVVSPWRHRDDIANVLELSAVRHPVELLNEVSARAKLHGANLVVSVEIDEVRAPVFYERSGFHLLEEVITFELDCRVAPNLEEGGLRFERVDVSVDSDRRLLMSIDHATFPWLWWNSDGEFLSYADAPGVELFVGYEGDEPIAYAGVTAYLGWGHLDRIAVLPERQGEGKGREALSFAINRLRHSGALRIGLSTQRNNTRSQRLYERFGFRRASTNDYRLYGKVLRMPDGIRSLTDRAQ